MPRLRLFGCVAVLASSPVYAQVDAPSPEAPARGLAPVSSAPAAEMGVPAALSAPPPRPPGPARAAPAGPSGGSRRPAEPGLERAVEISGFLQVDAIPHSESSADEVDPVTAEPLNEETVQVRRARLRLAGQRGPVRAELELEGDTSRGARARLLAARLDYQLDGSAGALALTAGVFKTPFGREIRERVEERWFVELSSASRALFPGVYDAGLGLRWQGFGLDCALAAMAGVPLGELEFGGRDPAASFDLVGRVGSGGALAPAVQVRGGVSALVGEGLHRGSRASKDSLTWVDANEDGIVQLSEIQVLSGSAATPSTSFERFALGADLGLVLALLPAGPTDLRAEVVLAENLDRAVHPADPVALGRDLRELGWHLALEQSLGRHLVLGARYERYDPDLDASEQRGVRVTPREASFSTWSFLAGMRRGDALRLVLQFDRNRNPLGRGADGAVATLPADRLTVRAQVRF